MIKPHGNKLVNKFLSSREASAIISQKAMPRLIIDHDTLLDLENIAVGAYSPLKGFMDKEQFQSVVIKKRLPQGQGLPWTIPITLAVQKKNILKNYGRNCRILLCNEKNTPIGMIQVKELYAVDKNKAAKHLFGTTSKEHPGVHKFYHSGDSFIAGEIWLIKKNTYPFHNFNLEPAAVRKTIEKKGWKSTVGFQTRNIPHRAHEFLQKIGLSLADGLLIHPIIGWKKKGDFNPEVIIKTYQILIDHYYAKERVIFSGLSTAMRYAGPKEAVFHAIIRKNYGCTHFIVGRDHAGVGGFYDKYAAHRIFDSISGLEIIPILLNGPYDCSRCRSVVNDKICPHHNTEHNIEISGTLIRKMLSQGRKIPEIYLRKEVSEFILKHKDKCFI